MSDSSSRSERPRRSSRPKSRGPVGGRGSSERGVGGKPRRDDVPRGDGKPVRDSKASRNAKARDGNPSREDRPTRRFRHEGRPSRDVGSRPARPTADRPRHDDPVIPDDVTANQLDRVVRAELKTLSKDNADRVARHLVMAGRLIDDDPESAHRHALAAQRRAGRVGVVRETVAITAYANGDFALALRELRTHRRITGSNDHLPMMVDSERGVGRPDRALELGRSVPRSGLPVPVQVELAIAMSGARLDLGQPEAALGELQIAQLDPDRAYPWSPALFDAYGTVLEELGRTEEAAEWFARSERASQALAEATAMEVDDVVEIIEEEIPDA